MSVLHPSVKFSRDVLTDKVILYANMLLNFNLQPSEVDRLDYRIVQGLSTVNSALVERRK